MPSSASLVQKTNWISDNSWRCWPTSDQWRKTRRTSWILGKASSDLPFKCTTRTTTSKFPRKNCWVFFKWWLETTSGKRETKVIKFILFLSIFHGKMFYCCPVRNSWLASRKGLLSRPIRMVTKWFHSRSSAPLWNERMWSRKCPSAFWIDTNNLQKSFCPHSTPSKKEKKQKQLQWTFVHKHTKTFTLFLFSFF